MSQKISVLMPSFSAPEFERTKVALSKLCSDSPIIGQANQANSLIPFIEQAKTSYALLMLEACEISIENNDLNRMIEIANNCGAAILYSDFWLENQNSSNSNNSKQLIATPLNDYQFGSVREGFDFGALVLVDISKAKRALNNIKSSQQGAQLEATQASAWYELRLALSLESLPVHVRECLYSKRALSKSSQHDKHFAYVDPSNRSSQIEFEQAFSRFAKRAGFYLEQNTLCINPELHDFKIEASIVIPVKNRKNTISDAIKSALEQQTNFDFNVIVVDNHSSDGTTELLEKIAAQDSRLIHIKPTRLDLLIGGCWNEAINSKHCGRFALQLDSDDIYINNQTAQKIVDAFRQERCAALVGAYQLVNFKLESIPPGLIDHREWNDQNGHNNALRINGLGAPRAFYTPVAREIGFPNVSYGEDYAMMLRILRKYKLGRIYEPLYLCRRWEGNSDAQPSVDTMNRFNAYKDSLRSFEIQARINLLSESSNKTSSKL